MRPTLTAALAAFASLALAGAAPARPAPEPLNVMRVALPDGSTARILYSGDTPPRVAVVPVEAVRPGALVPAWGFGPGGLSPFAWFERIAAEMDRRIAAMMRGMAPPLPLGRDAAGGLRLVAGGEQPAGAGSYSFVARSVSDGACTRIVEMTRSGNAAPRVVSRTSGDCGPAAEEPAAGKPEPEPVDFRQTI